jgi:undecaprenyl-diphosphatase
MLINKGAANEVLDSFVFLLAKKWVIMTVTLAVLAALFFGAGREAKRIVIVAAAAFLLGELMVFVLKNSISRARPCAELADVRLLVECPRSFSFPSRHATGAFSIMTVLSLGFRRYAPGFLAFAMAIGFLRVYAGVHYPTDVLAGAAAGAASALTVFYADRKYLLTEKILPWRST